MVPLSFRVVVLSLLALSGCSLPSGKSNWDNTTEIIDISEDLYHRMQAGLFVPGKEPLPLILMGGDPKGNLSPVAGQYLKLSWEMGSFWVKSNDRGQVILYMNREAAFSHVQMGPVAGGALLVRREFIENPVHPIWHEVKFATE